MDHSESPRSIVVFNVPTWYGTDLIDGTGYGQNFYYLWMGCPAIQQVGTWNAVMSDDWKNEEGNDKGASAFTSGGDYQVVHCHLSLSWLVQSDLAMQRQITLPCSSKGDCNQESCASQSEQNYVSSACPVSSNLILKLAFVIKLAIYRGNLFLCTSFVSGMSSLAMQQMEEYIAVLASLNDYYCKNEIQIA